MSIYFCMYLLPLQEGPGKGNQEGRDEALLLRLYNQIRLICDQLFQLPLSVCTQCSERGLSQAAMT